VRDGARVAAADPASDLSSPIPVPVSVIDAFQVVHNNLVANNVNDCGIDPSGGLAPTTTSALTWTYIGTTNCPPRGLTIIINRGYYSHPPEPLYRVTCVSQNLAERTAVIEPVSVFHMRTRGGLGKSPACSAQPFPPGSDHGCDVADE